MKYESEYLFRAPRLIFINFTANSPLVSGLVLSPVALSPREKLRFLFEQEGGKEAQLV
jgi:hypothetical protein